MSSPRGIARIPDAEYAEAQWPSYVLGSDIGGTFTDIVVYDRRNAAHHTRKVLTTPDDPARGSSPA